MPSSFDQLMKADRRKQWKGLKEKHSKAISKAKLDFDQKLGPALDKYQGEVEKLVKLSGKAELTSNEVQGVIETVWKLKPIVTTYKTTVKALEEPAKKEMTALLTAIDDDIKSWEQLTMNTMSSTPTGTTDAQKAAANAAINPLDEIRTMCLTLITRGPRAMKAYEAPKVRAHAKALTSEYVEAARVAGSASHELANLGMQVAKGSNYELFKQRAQAAIPLLERLRAGAHGFGAMWDINLDADKFTITSDIDAAALHQAVGQLDVYLDGAKAAFSKLP